MIRKCGKCKQNMDISLDNISGFIHYGNANYHLDCFIEVCEQRIEKKNTKKKWTEIYDNIEDIKHSSQEFLKYYLLRDDLNKFLIEMYDLASSPNKVFWQSIAEINNGNYKGLVQRIPIEHLLDMWTQKRDYLTKVYQKNCAKGKDMGTQSRIRYDLAILINKYTDYLKWLKKQEIQSIENEVPSEPVIPVSTFIQGKKETDIQKNNDDISDMLDDIFD